jgi:hypothetical protein
MLTSLYVQRVVGFLYVESRQLLHNLDRYVSKTFGLLQSMHGYGAYGVSPQSKMHTGPY